MWLCSLPLQPSLLQRDKVSRNTPQLGADRMQRWKGSCGHHPKRTGSCLSTSAQMTPLNPHKPSCRLLGCKAERYRAVVTSRHAALALIGALHTHQSSLARMGPWMLKRLLSEGISHLLSHCLSWRLSSVQHQLIRSAEAYQTGGAIGIGMKRC